MKFQHFYFLESVQISLSKKAWEKLSPEAKAAITRWESYNWVDSPLEKHIKANDSVAKEIKEAMKPILDSIDSDTVTLYRGASKKYLDEKRTLQSWTSSEKVAKHFAGLSSSQTKDMPTTYKIHSKQEIDDAVEKFNKTGFLKFDNKYYMKDKKNPGYYNIYDKHKEFITSGDDLREYLLSTNDDKIKTNEHKTKDKIVLKQTFDKDKIIWITNNLNSKEYIVRVD